MVSRISISNILIASTPIFAIFQTDEIRVDSASAVLEKLTTTKLKLGLSKGETS